MADVLAPPDSQTRPGPTHPESGYRGVHPTIGAVKNVLLVGSYPPPYGGEAVQIAMLQELLSGLQGYACRVLDIGTSRRVRRPECLPSRNVLEFARRLLGHAVRQDLIHLNTNGHNLISWLLICACAAAGVLNGRKTVVSIGSGAAPEFVRAARGPSRFLVKVALGLAGAVICRNERMRRALVASGVRPEKITTLSEFFGIRTDDLPEIPPEIGAYLKRQSPVVAAFASGGPEYGIPLLREAVVRLRKRHPHLGLMLIGSGDVGMSADVGPVLVTGELPHGVALSVIRKVNVFVRPTYFDGDAVSVREALTLRVSVVASDTDFRPEGVILFRRGDVDDLIQKLEQAFEHGPSEVPDYSADLSSFDRLLRIYDSLATGPERSGR